MLDRELAQVLGQSNWASWTVQEIAPDASDRLYYRLIGPNGGSVILMDARKSAPASMNRFVELTGFLQHAGLRVPDLLDQAHNGQILFLSDLGRMSVAALLDDHPHFSQLYFREAAHLVARVSALTPPDNLTVMSPMVAGEMVKITASTYCQDASLGTDFSDSITDHFARLCSPPDTLSLRDFHVENMVVDAATASQPAIGLIDYQDAFVAPDGYDLVSLIRDARRDVPAAIASDLIRGFQPRSTTFVADPEVQLALLSVQRNLRILGIFAALITDGKPKYASMLHRVWTYVMNDLDHRDLHRLKSVIAPALPRPDVWLSNAGTD